MLSRTFSLKPLNQELSPFQMCGLLNHQLITIPLNHHLKKKKQFLWTLNPINPIKSPLNPLKSQDISDFFATIVPAACWPPKSVWTTGKPSWTLGVTHVETRGAAQRWATEHPAKIMGKSWKSHGKIHGKITVKYIGTYMEKAYRTFL